MGNKEALLLCSQLVVLGVTLMISATTSSSSSSCPIDLGYVKRVAWDRGRCSTSSRGGGGGRVGECCQALLGLYGMGIAQYLKDTSMFQLPTLHASSSCLSEFQQILVSTMSLSPSLVPLCFPDPKDFVGNASKCAGIFTARDWTLKAGAATPLDIACKGDLSVLSRCSLCREAAFKVNSQLTNLDPNASSNCFEFICLYATAFSSDAGPMDPATSACTLSVPLTNTPENRKPSSSTGSSKGDGLVVKVVLASLGGVLGGVLLAFVLAALYKKRVREKEQLPFNSSWNVVDSVQSSFRANAAAGARWFRLEELERATNGFSQANLLGKGGYGVVYKGTLEDGTLVAVKQMHPELLEEDNSRGDEEFSNEVEIISKIRHRNLLSLRGCCSSGGVKCRYLVYDYMSNGSLGDFLYNDSKRKLLTWPRRKNIILDVANGLAYLHNGIKPAIYHRDIKATNILLDLDMKAKVADFGLAKQTLDGRSHVTTRVAGTHGYLAPEYALYGQLTEKSDVYSFGIVVLEIMSGRKALEFASSDSANSLVLITDWAWQLAKSGKITEILDETIKEQGAKGLMERFVLVGLLCAHMMVAFRPTMGDALKMLEGDTDIPPLPDRPMPLAHRPYYFDNISTLSTSKTSGWSSSTSGTI